MKSNLEGHRSLFLLYAACLPRLVFLHSGGYMIHRHACNPPSANALAISLNGRPVL
jgi:hypothetical protein